MNKKTLSENSRRIRRSFIATVIIGAPMLFGVRKGNAFYGASFCKFTHCNGAPPHYFSMPHSL